MEEQKVYDVITNIKVQLEGLKIRQEERHSENKQDTGVLFKKIDRITDDFTKLPCKANGVMIKALFIIFGTGLLGALVTVLVRKAIAG